MVVQVTARASLRCSHAAPTLPHGRRRMTNAAAIALHARAAADRCTLQTTHTQLLTAAAT